MSLWKWIQKFTDWKRWAWYEWLWESNDMSLWNWVFGRIHLCSTSWSPNTLFISNEPYCSKDNIVRSFVENLFTAWQPRSLVLRWFDACLVVIPPLFFFFFSHILPLTYAKSSFSRYFCLWRLFRGFHHTRGNFIRGQRPYGFSLLPRSSSK